MGYDTDGPVDTPTNDAEETNEQSNEAKQDNSLALLFAALAGLTSLWILVSTLRSGTTDHRFSPLGGAEEEPAAVELVTL